MNFVSSEQVRQQKMLEAENRTVQLALPMKRFRIVFNFSSFVTAMWKEWKLLLTGSSIAGC